jgi:hypothetical protein
LSRPATLEKWKVDLRPDEEDAIKLGALRRSLEEAREELRYMKTRASDSLPGRKTPGTFPEHDVDVVVGMNWRLTPKLRARGLAAPVGDHFIHVHVELGAASRHSDMQRKHVLMATSEDFITGLNNWSVPIVV